MRERADMDDSIRVCHVFGNLNVGGAERRTLEVIQAINREGGGFHFYAATMLGDGGVLEDVLLREGVEVCRFNIRSVCFPWQFFRFLRQERIHAIHSHIHLASAVPLVLACAARVPIRIFHARTEVPKSARPQFVSKRIISAIKELLLRCLIRTSSTVLAGVSPTSINSLFGKGWHAASKIIVLKNGVPVVQRDSGARLAKRQQMMQDLGIAEDSFLVLHVGRADIPTKNREFALDILPELVRRQPNAHLVFVGRDAATPALARESRASWVERLNHTSVQSHVHFLGEREDVRELLHGADRLLLTSTHEGVPGVVLEALAEGCAVVASALAGVCALDEPIGLTTVALADPHSQWVDALLAQTPPSLAISQGFAASGWSLAANLRDYIDTWQGMSPCGLSGVQDASGCPNTILQDASLSS